MENCIFCQIIDGQIPASKVYEDEKVLAFLDISQTTKGHTLVVPKKHARNTLEMSGEEAGELFSRVPAIARAIQKTTNAKGMNIIANNEEIAGQTVFHTHIHLVPRFDETDGIGITYTANEPDFEALAQLAQTISGEVTL